MKVTKLILFLLLLAGGARVAMAQAEYPKPPRTTKQVLEIWVANTEDHLVNLADAMPEDKYPFAPTKGEFKGVRTFAEQVKHVAANNYLVSNFILGRTPTQDQREEVGPESVKTKTEIMDYLRKSFALLHEAVASINDKNLVEPLPGASKGRLTLALETRIGLVIDTLAHSNNHYGQLVEYLRMNGIVPPASR